MKLSASSAIAMADDDKPAFNTRFIVKLLIMFKLTACILLITALHVSASTFSQKVSISAKNISLEKVFRSLQKQTGYQFFYSAKVVEGKKPVTVDIREQPLESALQMVLKGQGLEFEIAEDKIVVIKNVELEEAADLSPRLPSLTSPPITGIVRDSTGSPLSGATVYNKRTKKSVQTNAKGEFSIEGEEGDALQLSFIGFENQNVTVNGHNVFAVMRVSTSPLDEVQIMAYGTTSRRSSTANITTIKAEEIAKQPIDNPILALQGRVPGLTITPSSGLPGAPINLQIRGQNSLLGKFTEPLIVIDGIPYTNNIPGVLAINDNPSLSALHFVNPYDIESIDVLKDADATAIYGSRGANGVILITTKKGKMGSTHIDVNAYTGFNQRGNKKLKLLNTQQYIAMRKEAFVNDELPIPTIPAEDNYDLTVWDQNRYADWQDVFGGDKGRFSSIQATVSGGVEAVQYLISGTYNGQSSFFPGHAKDESGIGHFSITGVSSNKKLKATLTGSYTVNRSSIPDFTFAALSLAPNAPSIYKDNGELNWEPNPLTGYATWVNPFASLSNVATSKTNSINVSTDLSYQLLPGLQLKTLIGFSNLQFKSFSPITIASQDPATWGFATGSAFTTNNASSSWSIEPQASYSKTILNKGRLLVIAGGTLQGQKFERQTIGAFGYKSDALLRNLASAQGYFPANGNSEYKYAGIFGRLNYSWEEKYIINLNGRRDGSSRFGTEDQYNNFGSIGVAWVFTSESFAQDAFPFLSFGKLRASYGTSGNDAIRDYQYLELYNNISGNVGMYQNINTIQSQGAVNPYYHWESTRKLEAAMEIGFLKDRILLSAAYFRNRSSDQLGNYTLPATAGNLSIVINQPAKLQNSGAEFTLTTMNIRSRNFTWSTTANLSFTRNKLLELPADFNAGFIYGWDNPLDAIGKPFSGYIPVYEFKGVDPNSGYYQFSDDKGSPTLDPEAAKYNAKHVNTVPKYLGGISNSFSYKDFRLDIFCQFAKQIGRNYLYDYQWGIAGVFQGAYIGGTANQPIDIMDRWQNKGNVTNIQKYSQNYSTIGAIDRLIYSDAAWVDASFFKLKNVSISYSFPPNWKEKLKVQNFRVYIQGQNLFMITPYKGPDPETQNVQAVAQQRVITAGISLGF